MANTSRAESNDEVDNLASQLEGLSTTQNNAVIINYAAYGYAKVPLVESGLLQDLLIGEKKAATVFVGEKNFTFTVAIATLRKSWEGIISTRFENVSDYFPEPQFGDVKLQCISNCISNSKAFSDENTDGATLKIIQQILNLQPPPAEVWHCGIDATSIPPNITVKGKVVWFQCPWVPNAHKDQRLFKLIHDFLSHVSGKQSQGDYVLIGIANLFPYSQNYRLQDLLGVTEGRFGHQCCGYKLLGVDDTLIKEILQFGYKHETVHGTGCDIHKEIISHHITLVFQKE